MQRLLAQTHCLSPGSCHLSLPVPASPLLSHDWCHDGTMMQKPWQSRWREMLMRITHMRLKTLQSVHFQLKCTLLGFQRFHRIRELFQSKSAASENHCGLREYLKPSHDFSTSWVLPGCFWVTHPVGLKEADVKKEISSLFQANTPSTSQQKLQSSILVISFS